MMDEVLHDLGHWVADKANDAKQSGESCQATHAHGGFGSATGAMSG